MAMQSRTGFDAYNNKIINVANGANPADAVNFQQLQNIAAGANWKAPARAATTAAGGNITLSATQTVDGVAVIVGDRVLVKNQTDATANGIYVVASGAWARSSDATSGVLSSGAVVDITEGTVNDNTSWMLYTNNPITVGTTSQNWQPFSVAGTTYTGGNGIAVSGSVINANVDGTSLLADGTSLRINPAYSGLRKATYSANLPAIAANSTATITHNLGTTDFDPSFQDITGTPFFVNYDITSVTTTTLVVVNGSTALAAGAARIICIPA